MRLFIAILSVGFFVACAPAKFRAVKDDAAGLLGNAGEGDARGKGKDSADSTSDKDAGNSDKLPKADVPDGTGDHGSDVDDKNDNPGQNNPGQNNPGQNGGGSSEGCETFQREIVFVEYNQGCKWGVDGNLGPKVGHLQAIQKQNVRVTLPPHSRMCKVRLRSLVEPKLRYNDAIVLNLENYVMATGEGWIKDFLMTANGGLKWDWNAVKGKAMGNVVTANQPLCYGASAKCVVQPRATNASIDVQIKDTDLAKLIPILQGKKALNFDLLTGGDGNNSNPYVDTPLNDCYHKEVRFNFEMEYEP